MMKLTDLYRQLHNEGVFLLERPLGFQGEERAKAATMCLRASQTWGIFLDASRIETLAEETCILFHECGHYSTGSTHEVCSPFALIAQHENRADKWAIKKLIPKDELDQAVADGYRELWALAEYFGVTEEFMRKAVCWYQHGNLDVGHYMLDV